MNNGLIIYQVMRVLAAQPFVEIVNFQQKRISKHNKNPQNHFGYNFERISCE